MFEAFAAAAFGGSSRDLWECELTELESVGEIKALTAESRSAPVKLKSS